MRDPGHDVTLAWILRCHAAIRLVEQSESEPAMLRAQVTSKGGTTERAIASLESASVKAAIAAAVKAAALRSSELGEQLGKES